MVRDQETVPKINRLRHKISIDTLYYKAVHSHQIMKDAPKYAGPVVMFRLPAAMYRQAKREARRQVTTISQIARNALKAYLDGRKGERGAK